MLLWMPARRDDLRTEAGLPPWPLRGRWRFASSLLSKINNRLQMWDHLETKVFLLWYWLLSVLLSHVIKEHAFGGAVPPSPTRNR